MFIFSDKDTLFYGFVNQLDVDIRNLKLWEVGWRQSRVLLFIKYRKYPQQKILFGNCESDVSSASFRKNRSKRIVMAKYTEDFSTFNYNWEQVSQGFWRRYPNPYASHVLTEDTLQREVRQDGKLYSKRILSKTNRVPKWGERFFKSKSVFIVEESIVDPANKTLTTLTRNIGFNKIMVRTCVHSFVCKIVNIIELLIVFDNFLCRILHTLFYF